MEGEKDCLYQDHSLADQLTGAFKIVKDAGGVVRVVFQASSDAAAEQGEVRDRLLRLLQARWRGEVAVEVLAPMAFAWRPVLDHERKFAYLDSSAA